MSAMSNIRILLADDHTLFRAGIRALLKTLGDIEVVAEASDGREALRLVGVHRPDVVLLDILMPSLNGLDAAAQMSRACSRSRVIILSRNTDADSVLRALRAGAVGYLVKTADPAELEMAIQATTRGEKFFSSAISEHLVAACLGRLEKEQNSLERLTPRQREVLQLVAEGHRTKEIAKELKLASVGLRRFDADV